MDRRSFIEQATRFLAGLAAAPLLKLLPESKPWTTPMPEVYPKFNHVSFPAPLPRYVFDMVKHMEAEMDRQTGVVDLRNLNG